MLNLRKLLWSLLLATFALQVVAQPKLEPADKRDCDVLEPVLTNLLSNPQMAQFLKGKTPRTEVVLLNQTSGILLPPKQEIEKEIRRTLSDEEYSSLVSRNSTERNHAKRVSLSGLQTVPKIILVDGAEPIDEQFESKYPNARGWVQLSLPGYSSDGNRAIVRGRKGPALHGAAITAHLEKKEEKWSITWIKITYWR